MLKSYQDEIDRLTKRSKFSEAAFLSLYKVLAEVPDPVPAFESLLNEVGKSSRVAELEHENRKLQKELETFRKDFQDVKNQEVTIRRLEDKLRDYEAKMEDLVAAKVEANARSLREAHEKELEKAGEREAALQRKVAVQQEELARVAQALEAAQKHYFELKERYDEDQHTKQLELDLLASEVDRASQRALALERERDKLREQLRQAEQLVPAAPPPPQPDLELQLAQKEIELSRLHEEHTRLEASLRTDLEALRRQLVVQQEQLDRERARAQALQRQLEGVPPREELERLRRQSELLRSLEYTPAEGEAATVEGLLRARARQLENEATRLRASLAEREQELAQARAQVQALQEQCATLTAQTQRLEEDILRLRPPEPSDSAPSLPGSPAGAGGESNTSNSMLAIVCAQRDRFKLRIQELEADAARLQADLGRARSEVSSLQGDNLKLFEKIKYLESYGEIAKSRPADLEIVSGQTDVEQKYRPLYEESVNPFAVFSKKERDKRFSQLTAADKITLSTTRFFLSNKYTRTFLLVYSVLLHALVFVSVYRSAVGSAVSVTCPPNVNSTP